MPFLPNDEIVVEWRYVYLGEECENVQTYLVGGVSSVLFTMTQVLEALWNDYKSRWHAIMSTSSAINSFNSLHGEQRGGALQFGDYSVPLLERVGAVALTNPDDWTNSFSAVAVRQEVGSRLTRPGQKRFPFVRDGIAVGNVLLPAAIPAFDDLGGAFSQVSVLGAPALGMALQPQVVHEPGARDPVRHLQPVTGWSTNPAISSQVSRKQGR